MQKSAFKSYKMLSNALKNPKSFLHVVAGKSTNNVVESSKSPVITGFFYAPNTSEYALDTLFKSKIAIF